MFCNSVYCDFNMKMHDFRLSNATLGIFPEDFGKKFDQCRITGLRFSTYGKMSFGVLVQREVQTSL